MKKISSLLIFAVAALTTTAQSPVITKSFAAGAIKSVEAETSGGNIAVAGKAAEAKVELYATANNSRNNNLSEQEIKEKLNADYDIKIEQTGDKLTATARPKKRIMNWKKALSISFRIYVAESVSTNLSTSGGNIDLKNVKGNQDISTSGGNLTIGEVAGKLNGTTSGGNITIQGSKDEIELATSGGNVEARNCEGKIKLTTSGGNLELFDLKGNIKANTSGGNISGQTIEGELAVATSGGNIGLSLLSCSVTATTSGGDIAVSVKKLAGNVRLVNSGGNINLDIPQGSSVDLDLTADKIKTDKMENFSGKLDEEKIEGKLNGGGSTVTVRCDGGRIHLGLK